MRAVEATGSRTLIMAGTTNDGCLVYTALSTKQAGYEVYAVLDAGGSVFQYSEEIARLRMIQAGVNLITTAAVLGELARDWATPHGAQIRKLLAENLTITIGGFGLAK
ncbi:isochorismatase family protein [Micromonospora costi]|uniref:Isochorismatase family protein n=1 Tax=Micromonospora costi TaxID=1530042 RepID=A0A3B0A4H9_9ACTN|nr:isochorismatase family protein [Micromonospora costi]RKN55373.1 isochorismatase family protein [Micromonospora costi]